MPSTPPRSQRQVLTDLAAAMGARPARVSGLPWPVVGAIGAVSPQMREIAAIRHQWDADFVVDGSETVRVLGIEPTPWDEVCRATRHRRRRCLTGRRPARVVTVAVMGLVTAWVLVALAVLAALWCATGAVRLTRRARSGGAR